MPKRKTSEVSSKSIKSTKKKNINSEKKQQPKTLNRRDRKQYPGLSPGNFSKAKQQQHDIDYAHLLSDKDKDFMSRFMEEWVGARLNHPGKLINKGKTVRKKIYDANNARNRDIMSIHYKMSDSNVEQLENTTGVKALDNDTTGNNPNSMIDYEYEYKSPEDALIDIIDNRKEIENKLRRLEEKLKDAELLQPKDNRTKTR